MKQINLEKTTTLVAVVSLSTLLLCVAILGILNPPVKNVLSIVTLLFYCCALIPLSFLGAVWLVYKNRDSISKFWIWLSFQLLFAISIGTYSVPNAFFSLIFSTLLLLLFPLLGLIDFLYAFKNGNSLQFISWGSAGLMWMLLIAWRIEGNLLDKWIRIFINGSNDFWWLYFILFGGIWIVVAGSISFLFETVHILMFEFSNK